MAVRADANGEYLIRTAGSFYALDVMTVCFWARLSTDLNASTALFGLRTEGGQYTYFYNVNNDGTTFVWESFPNTVGSINMSLDTWYFCAISRAGSGTNQTNGYVRTAAATSFTTSQATFSHADTPTEEIVLANGFSPTDSSFRGRIASLKQWNAGLTAEELWNESQQFMPVRTANLHSWRPMVDSTVANCALDYSGNGRNLTPTGTLSIEDGPPIVWRQGMRRIFIPSAGGGGGQTISPSAIASAEAFGTATLTPGAVTISPTGVASAEAFGTAQLNLNVAPSGIASAEAFGTPALTTSYVVTGTGIASGEAFGTAVVTPGPVTVSPGGIASDEAFGNAVVSSGASVIAPSGIASGEAFGNATLTALATITVSGIATAETFGTALVSSGGLLVAPPGIASAEAFGSAVLSPGTVSVIPSGIASAEEFGTPGLTATFTVSTSGIASAEAFGQPEVNLLLAVVSPTGIASGEAFGVAVITGGGMPLALAVDNRTFDAWSGDYQDVESSWADNRSVDLT